MCVLPTLCSQIPEGSDLFIVPEQQKHHISCFMSESAVGKAEREKTENRHVGLFAKSRISACDQMKKWCAWDESNNRFRLVSSVSVSCKCAAFVTVRGMCLIALSLYRWMSTPVMRFLWCHAAHCALSAAQRLSLGSLCGVVLFSHELSPSCHLHPDPRPHWIQPQNRENTFNRWDHQHVQLAFHLQFLCFLTFIFIYSISKDYTL